MRLIWPIKLEKQQIAETTRINYIRIISNLEIRLGLINFIFALLQIKCIQFGFLKNL